MEGPMSYSSGMDRCLKWANHKLLKVDSTKGGKPKSIVKCFFPAPALPHTNSAAYCGPVTPEAVEALHWDLQREATAWGRTLTATNSRDGHLVACENIYTKERKISEPVFGAIRSASSFEYLHGISGYTPPHIFTAVQPSKFTLGSSVVSQPHPARSIVSDNGVISLRPGYMAAYTRSLLPVYMAYGNDPSMGDKGLVASYVKARANIPNITMPERSWAYLCFIAGQQDKEAPTYVCVNKGRHSAMQDFVNLEQLNQHMSNCFPNHEDLVLGQCSLTGILDFPESRDNSGGKKARKD